MNITFFIGNGFDLNLGLKTKYFDFFDYFKSNIDNKIQNKIVSDYKKNEVLWSNAELALGQFTKKFRKNNKITFSMCHEELCKKLSTYLKEQQRGINYLQKKEEILKEFDNLNNLTAFFPSQEKTILDKIYYKKENESIRFNFVSFNYTYVFDNCLKIVRENSKLIGSHIYKQNTLYHTLSNLYHIHGTVDKNMIFGVNDESQIAKPDIFDFQDGDLDKNYLIKQKANFSFREGKDETVLSVLKDSDIIYIYGMSIGETDKIWWERIIQWLKENEGHHLIIYDFNTNKEGVYPVQFLKYERKKKYNFIKYDTDNFENLKTEILNQIHITNYNIFGGLKNIFLKQVC